MGGSTRKNFTVNLRKSENEALFRRRRMQIVNVEGNLTDHINREREKFTAFHNYLKLICSMNEGNPEIVSDTQLNLNASNIEFVSKTLDEYQTTLFTKEILALGAHKAINQYILAYLHNRNNPDIEQACASALHIFSVCSQGS